MSKSRQWTAGALVLALAIVVIGWLALISPQRSHASSVKGQAASQQQANLALQQKISMLSKQAAGVAQNEARIAQIATELPASPQLAAYVRDLSQAATQAHVELVSISPSSPTALASPTAAAPAAPAASPSDGASPASAPAAAPASAVPLQSIALALTVNGDYFAIQQFVSKLEQLRRVTLVNAVSLAPGSPLKPESATAANPAAAGASPGAGSSEADSVPQWRTLNGSITITIFESGVNAEPALASSAPGATAPTGAAGSAGSAGPRPAPSGNK